MEETKLDKFIGKIFGAIEKATGFLQDESGKSKVFFRIMILQFFLGVFFTLRYFVFSSNSDEPNIIKIFNYLQGPLMIFLSLVLLFQRLKNFSDIDLKILKFSRKLYSEEITKLCFEPLIADWKNEYSEAVSQNRNWKAYCISVRYAYAFVSAMFQQSWLGRLIEFIQKPIK